MFNAGLDPANNERIAWVCKGISYVNGAPLFDEGSALTLEPSVHPSHWMNPRGPRGECTEEDEDDYEDAAAYEAAKAVEWRCGWCGAENDTAKAKAPCGEPEARFPGFPSIISF